MQCLVTGASGYIGRALVAALAADGCRVHAVVRSGAVPMQAEESTRADLCGGLAPGVLAGAETLFHLAAVAHHRASPEAYRRTNVDAAARLAEQAAAAGVRRFIFLSSVKAALAAAPGDAPVDDYARSKAAAEAALTAVAAQTGMELLIVRPALVYGGEPRGYLRWLERWARARLPAPPPGGRRAMLARSDLVQLLLALRTCPVASPVTVIATDGECYSARRLHGALADALRRRPLLPSPPAAVWRGICRVADLLLRAPAGSSWHRLQGDEYYVGTDLESLCGYRPRLRFEDVVAEQANAA